MILIDPGHLRWVAHSNIIERQLSHNLPSIIKQFLLKIVPHLNSVLLSLTIVLIYS